MPGVKHKIIQMIESLPEDVTVDDIFSTSNVAGNHCIQVKLSDKNNNTFTHKINFDIRKLVS